MKIKEWKFLIADYGMLDKEIIPHRPILFLSFLGSAFCNGRCELIKIWARKLFFIVMPN